MRLTYPRPLSVIINPDDWHRRGDHIEPRAAITLTYPSGTIFRTWIDQLTPEDFGDTSGEAMREAFQQCEGRV